MDSKILTLHIYKKKISAWHSSTFRSSSAHLTKVRNSCVVQRPIHKSRRQEGCLKNFWNQLRNLLCKRRERKLYIQQEDHKCICHWQCMCVQHSTETTCQMTCVKLLFFGYSWQNLTSQLESTPLPPLPRVQVHKRESTKIQHHIRTQKYLFYKASEIIQFGVWLKANVSTLGEGIFDRLICLISMQMLSHPIHI